jgi:hypothetical protein
VHLLCCLNGVPDQPPPAPPIVPEPPRLDVTALPDVARQSIRLVWWVFNNDAVYDSYTVNAYAAGVWRVSSGVTATLTAPEPEIIQPLPPPDTVSANADDDNQFSRGVCSADLAAPTVISPWPCPLAKGKFSPVKENYTRG